MCLNGGMFVFTWLNDVSLDWNALVLAVAQIMVVVLGIGFNKYEENLR